MRSVKRPCAHEPRDILGLMLQQELVAVACFDCSNIKLLDPLTGKASVAFQSKNSPLQMCQGEQGRLWVWQRGNPIHISELNCTTKKFTETGRRISTALGPGTQAKESYLCYLPLPYHALANSFSELGVASYRIDCSDSWVWRVTEAEAKKIQHCSLLFSPKHQVLLVVDSDHQRLLVVHPGVGSILSSLQLPTKVGEPKSICLYKDQLAILGYYAPSGQHRISFLSITESSG